MPCPLYIGLAPGNPLRICGPKDRLGYVPSSAHMKLFCLSVSVYLVLQKGTHKGCNGKTK